MRHVILAWLMAAAPAQHAWVGMYIGSSPTDMPVAEAWLTVRPVPLTATRPDTTKPPAYDLHWKDALLTAREAVWRDFFGAPDALAAVLTEDFIAINSGGPWRNRVETIADSREARAAGSMLTELVFPETRVQRYGDVAIIYTTYRFTVKRGTAEPTTSAGRATEMFRLDGGRWLHTGWHLDEAP